MKTYKKNIPKVVSFIGAGLLLACNQNIITYDCGKNPNCNKSESEFQRKCLNIKRENPYKDQKQNDDGLVGQKNQKKIHTNTERPRPNSSEFYNSVIYIQVNPKDKQQRAGFRTITEQDILNKYYPDINFAKIYLHESSIQFLQKNHPETSDALPQGEGVIKQEEALPRIEENNTNTKVEGNSVPLKKENPSDSSDKEWSSDSDVKQNQDIRIDYILENAKSCIDKNRGISSIIRDHNNPNSHKYKNRYFANLKEQLEFLRSFYMNNTDKNILILVLKLEAQGTRIYIAYLENILEKNDFKKIEEIKEVKKIQEWKNKLQSLSNQLLEELDPLLLSLPLNNILKKNQFIAIKNINDINKNRFSNDRGPHFNNFTKFIDVANSLEAIETKNLSNDKKREVLEAKIKVYSNLISMLKIRISSGYNLYEEERSLQLCEKKLSSLKNNSLI